MPRIGGLNLVALIAAILVFYGIGFVFFGLIYEREWLLEILSSLDYDGKSRNIEQLSNELLQSEWKKAFPDANAAMGLGLGFLNAVISVIGLALVLKHLTSDAPGLFAALGWTVVIVFGFVISTLAYDHIYAMASMPLFWMNFWYLICAYGAAALILTVID